MKLRKLILKLCFAFIWLAPVSAFALPKVAVLYMPTGSDSIDILSKETVIRLSEVYTQFGRFELVEAGAILAAETAVKSNEAFAEATRVTLIKEIAREAGADIVTIVSLYQQGVMSYGEMLVEPLDSKYSSFEQRVRTKSKIQKNIPVLLEKEAIKLHKKTPIHISALERRGEYIVIDAGTYSGLKSGSRYALSNGSSIELVTAGRYTSFVLASRSFDTATILVYPKTNRPLAQTEKEQKENIFKKYGASYTYSKNDDPERRYIESLLVINPFGNILIPGFGGFLATHYNGFENAERSFVNIGATASLYLFELFYIPVKNGFSVNFFPWIQDSDKSDSDARMHAFLWAMIPVTFTVSYLDHMAIQYHKDRVLPPGFQAPVSTALHTILIPGGGFFYKGYRAEGWAYFGAESLVAFYAVDNYGSDAGRHALYLLGGIKLAEIIHTYIVPSAYDFYNKEYYDSETTEFTFFIDENESYKTGFTLNF